MRQWHRIVGLTVDGPAHQDERRAIDGFLSAAGARHSADLAEKFHGAVERGIMVRERPRIIAATTRRAALAATHDMPGGVAGRGKFWEVNPR